MRKKLVYGQTSETEFLISSFTFGDVVPVIFTLLRFSGSLNNYAVPEIDSIGLQFYLSDVPAVDPSGATAFVTQLTWAQNTVLRQFSADIAFNTNALSTWLSTAASKPATMRFKMTEGANTTEIYRRDVTIYAGSATVGAVAAGETPLSLERANNTFVKKLGAASEYRVLTSQGGLKFREFIDEDGIVHYDPIT